MKIVFMGTPQFAVPALEKLINSSHQIVAVYTREPKPSGRGQQIAHSPVHHLADKYGIKVFNPKTFKDDTEVEELKKLSADIIVVAAYGLILPKSVLEAFKYGAINIHPSQLPRWRGAAPIQRTIMSGDEETAVCIMQMDEGLDTGDILLEKIFPISETVTAHELIAILAEEGASLLRTVIDMIDKGNQSRKQQKTQGVTYANKITREEEIITWDKDARIVNCQIRALSPKPGAYFNYNNEIVKIIVAEYEAFESNEEPGTVIDDKLTIACKSGVLKPKLMQRQGRKMLYTEAFLRGFPIAKGTKL